MGKTFIGSCLLASLSQDMPWLAFASNDLKSASDLMQHFNVDGIPRVILLDPELKLISKEARRTIMTDRDGQYFPWRPEPIMPLDDAALTFIDNFPFMLAMTDGSEKQISSALAALKKSAESEFVKDDPQLRFFYVKDPDEEILELLRKAAKISSQEQLIILDMNFDRKYVAANQKISSMNVASFVRSFVEGRLTPVTFHAIHHD
eukprot:m.836157 g.836157  ORF g.836157 m.836157 type:complete len:205 (-) comp59479_c0_seq56:121-735(-)